MISFRSFQRRSEDCCPGKQAPPHAWLPPEHSASPAWAELAPLGAQEPRGWEEGEDSEGPLSLSSPGSRITSACTTSTHTGNTKLNYRRTCPSLCPTVKEPPGDEVLQIVTGSNGHLDKASPIPPPAPSFTPVSRIRRMQSAYGGCGEGCWLRFPFKPRHSF